MTRMEAVTEEEEIEGLNIYVVFVTLLNDFKHTKNILLFYITHFLLEVSSLEQMHEK